MNSYWPVEREVCGTAGLFLGPGCLPRGRPISCYCTCISSTRLGDANASWWWLLALYFIHFFCLS